jgi:L-alanine-DL-glutamate epimerase-like enolase superfamily enzyme
MRITDVVATVFPLEQVGKYTGAVRPRRWEVIACRVETDEGVVGESASFSLSSGSAQASILGGFLGPAVLGRDPLEVEDLWRFAARQDRIGQGTCRYAHASLDVAAWDIVGKVAGRPLHELFGAERTEMRVYGTMSVQESPERYAAVASDLVERGLTALKLFVWGDPARDLAACAAVRAAVGDDVDLMADPAGAYDRDAALEVGRGLEDLGFRWLEEPVDDRDLRSLRWLRERLSIPIVGAETYEVDDYPNVVPTGAWDAVRPDVGVIRGITPCRRAVELAREAGVGIEGHTYAMPPVAAANLHILLGVPECELFEIPLPFGSLDEGSLRSLEVDLGAGVVRAPQGPGLGTAIDWDPVARTATLEVRASEQT